jgi:hypothetical protein
MTSNNGGTKGEIQCVDHCVENRNNSTWCKKNFDCPNIELLDPKTKKVIEPGQKIQKTGSQYKADIVVRKSTGELIFPSIKTTNCAPPAILNHTHRNANLFQKKLVEYLPIIDDQLKFYIEKRKHGGGKEDINLLKLLNDSNGGDKERKAWIKVICYGAFEGTGKKDAICPADSIMEWDGNDIKLIICKTKEQKENYIESVLLQDRFTISIRDKAMPKNICPEHLPWIFEHHKDGEVKIKGSLHVRQSKKRTLNTLKKKELIKLCNDNNIDNKGTKKILVARLKENNIKI